MSDKEESQHYRIFAIFTTSNTSVSHTKTTSSKHQQSPSLRQHPAPTLFHIIKRSEAARYATKHSMSDPRCRQRLSVQPSLTGRTVGVSRK
jgi:hypothetical protein